jgi:hypothetical protein
MPVAPPRDPDGGDAVFAVGGVDVGGRSTLLMCWRAPAAQPASQADDSCACAACRSIGKLDLKIVAHHGRFLRQRVGDRSQAAGASVVLAHRLLKNGLPARAYILLTEAALRWAGLSADSEGLLPHLERYDHFGDVRCFVRPLESVAALPARVG